MMDGLCRKCKLADSFIPCGVANAKIWVILHALHSILNFRNNAPLICTGGGRVVRWCWVNFQCRGVLHFGLK